MTLILKPDLDMVKMYHHMCIFARYEVSMITAVTGTAVHRQPNDDDINEDNYNDI